MMNKILLSYDNRRLTAPFNYIAKLFFSNNLSNKGYIVTEDYNDDYEAVIFPSSEDMMSNFPKIKKGVKTYLLALNDIEDYADNHKKIQLSMTAYNYFQKADCLLVFYESQKKFLLENKVTTKIKVIDLNPTYSDDNISQEEKESFRHYLQLESEKVTIVTFGALNSKDDYNLFESIARLFPDKEFLYFGKLDKEFYHLRLQERLSQPINIRYCLPLREELYHSALLTADCFFSTQKVLPNILAINDFNAHGVPIIFSNEPYVPEITELKNTQIITNFEKLYQKIKDIQKIERNHV